MSAMCCRVDDGKFVSFQVVVDAGGAAVEFFSGFYYGSGSSV